MTRLSAARLLIAVATVGSAPARDPSRRSRRPLPTPQRPSTCALHMEDFARGDKVDAHVHVNVARPVFLEQARADGFELMSINVDYPDFPKLGEQRAASLAQVKAQENYRPHITWATTFSMQGFGKPKWQEKVSAELAADVAQGAKAVKIWKNVGMAEKDASGKLIMLDHPGISAVADRIQALGITLIGHQGEPHNCWLPLEQMTTDNDREYFRNHPNYHMYLHPEMPGYEDQIKARDNFVAAHTGLRFVGAHLGSLEYDVERIAAFLDRFPNTFVDMAARMSQVQYQSVRDHEKVRNFFIKYQDRLLYGTDLTLNPDELASDANGLEFKRSAHQCGRGTGATWLPTSPASGRSIKADVPGLATAARRDRQGVLPERRTRLRARRVG